MNERWLIIGADERMKQLAKNIVSDERTIFYKNKRTWDAELNEVALDYQPTVVILPIQPLAIEVANVLGLEQALIHAGKLSERWQTILKNNQVHLYLEQESFIWQNAALTAEALLAYHYEKRRAVRGKTFIITGFGRVAKMMAATLTGLQANVIIVTRSEAQRCEANALCYKAYLLEAIPQLQASALINTIPAKWLGIEVRKQLSMPIYDLASTPGCAIEPVESYTLLSGLPGKYFPKDAAQLLQQAIFEWREQHAKR